MKVEYNSLVVARGGRVVISDLTASMPGPGLYQVVGPNSVGKTTLLLATIGVVKPVSGTVHVEPKNMVSYMPQEFSLPLDAPVSTYEFVRNHLVIWGRKGLKIDADARTRDVLELVGVPRSLWSERISRLSGGMLRRVLLARALAPYMPILLLDEPLTGVDPEGKVDVANLMCNLSKDKLVILTNHDPVLMLECTRRILLLGHGFYDYGEPDEILRYEVLSKFYKKCAIEVEKHVHVVDWH